MEWISVDDRLPEPGQIVDIYNYHDGRVPDVRFKGEDDWISLYMCWTGRVIYWMPLPAPPKDGE